MKKSLIYTAAYTLSITALISVGYANASEKDSTLPHIDGNVQFPLTRWGIGGNFRHSFRLHVPKNSKAVTQLLIKIPENVTVSNDIKNIDIVDDNEHKINTNVSINGKTILLDFTEAVAPNTKFDVDLNKIKRRNIGNGYVYTFSAKEVGIDAVIPIGIAWFRLY
ncbi:MAG: DUF2808 domain-containing protein [Pelatocladus maniniholoensis HA4357-MV3]|jgi:hypothetical protein|uniref:DUF2808 domain-containing protein n=1 Tax=Pelatocladus maniniholoensis HA4357-MV3 TaxID=1117104 RepID=A0A9E3HA51_9NOST|nr:DUF2808 domain-containing protein [Pelatocladus maniniholoensis HA4357-MV3]BAZ67458.1 hypothetical protein NIES4106_22130 [Fischerella sp. NIES-4106]